MAILDGDHALYKVGERLEERGMVALQYALQGRGDALMRPSHPYSSV
jgi:hypothetical protein